MEGEVIGPAELHGMPYIPSYHMPAEALPRIIKAVPLVGTPWGAQSMIASCKSAAEMEHYQTGVWQKQCGVPPLRCGVPLTSCSLPGLCRIRGHSSLALLTFRREFSRGMAGSKVQQWQHPRGLAGGGCCFQR